MSKPRSLPSNRFWPYMLQGIVVVVVAAILTYLLHDSWLMGRMQHANLDSWFLSRESEWSDSLFIIRITNDDYKALFNSTSPLDPKLVQRIVQSIAGSGTAVIAVDIDTSG